MTAPDPQPVSITVDQDRVMTILRETPLGAAMVDAAHWRAAYEDAARRSALSQAENGELRARLDDASDQGTRD